jgi:predicted transposase YdaD
VRNYDAALKHVLQRWGSTIMLQLTGEEIVEWRSVELQKISSQYADLLAETASGRLCHIELQAVNDPQMAVRMLEYASRVYRIFGRFPEQTVLYVGRKPMRMQARMEAERLTFQYRLVDIRTLDGRQLLASDCVGDNILAILARWRCSAESVRRILSAIGRLEAADRAVALEVLLLLASLRKLEEQVEREARRMPVFDDILENKVLGREFKRGLVEGNRQGLEVGMQKGVQKGLQEGVQKGELNLVRRLITKRFGRISPSLDKRLARMTPPELESLSERILDANTLNDLFT